MYSCGFIYVPGTLLTAQSGDRDQLGHNKNTEKTINWLPITTITTDRNNKKNLHKFTQYSVSLLITFSYITLDLFWSKSMR
jgi:hypothetical protein